MKNLDSFLKNCELYINTTEPELNNWPLGFIGVMKKGDNPETQRPLCVLEFNPLTNSDTFVKNLKLTPEDGYNLVNACLEAGYQPFEDGPIGLWLYTNLGAITKNILTELEIRI